MSATEKTTSSENSSTVESLSEKQPLSEAEYKKLLRKLDLHLLPFVSLLYLLSFLDRANIGNARIAGLATDVHLDGLKYNVIAAVFFIPYALFEVPSNICLKLFRPSIWIPSIMVAWGTVMTLMCLCKTYEGLIVARVFLGLAEGGLFPGVTYYLSLWYRKRDVGVRIAIFFSAATAAGAFGGILAYGIEQMEGIGGLHGWQWIFCLEGLLTIVVAFTAFFFMHDYPATAKFLTEDERAVLIATLKEDSQGLATHFNKKFVWQAVKDYKTYIHMGIYGGVLTPVYAIALFAPTIVKELGFSAAQAQLLTIPIFVAGCFTTIGFGYLSDRFVLRGPFLIGTLLISLIGFLVLYTQDRPGVSYVGAVLAATGAYPGIAISLAWAGSAVGGDVRKGVVLAMVVAFGNLGGICSSFIFITPPRFFVGHGTSMGWLGLAITLSLFSMWDFNRLNKQKIALCEREGIDERRREDFREMGNESPLYR